MAVRRPLIAAGGVDRPLEAPHWPRWVCCQARLKSPGPCAARYSSSRFPCPQKVLDCCWLALRCACACSLPLCRRCAAVCLPARFGPQVRAISARRPAPCRAPAALAAPLRPSRSFRCAPARQHASADRQCRCARVPTAPRRSQPRARPRLRRRPSPARCIEGAWWCASCRLPRARGSRITWRCGPGAAELGPEPWGGRPGMRRDAPSTHASPAAPAPSAG